MITFNPAPYEEVMKTFIFVAWEKVMKTFPYDYCYHKWIKYEGLTERYEFCEYCDVKRDIIEPIIGGGVLNVEDIDIKKSFK